MIKSLSIAGDFERMGLASYTKLRMVKQNEINLCLTYPLELVVPAFISNKDLLQSAKYRSKNRLPVVTWFDIRTGASISRSSQPLVGMNSKRCFEDEKLIRELAALTFREGMDGELPCTFFIVDARSKVCEKLTTLCVCMYT
jgi:myotubularin-related protein 6/7/8